MQVEEEIAVVASRIEQPVVVGFVVVEMEEAYLEGLVVQWVEKVEFVDTDLSVDVAVAQLLHLDAVMADETQVA